MSQCDSSCDHEKPKGLPYLALFEAQIQGYRYGMKIQFDAWMKQKRAERAQKAAGAVEEAMC